MLGIKRKLIVGVVTILIMALASGFIYGSDDASSLSWTIWFFLLYMSPVVLILGTLTSIISDSIIRKIGKGENIWISLLLHALFAFLIMVGFIFYDANLSDRPFNDQYSMWSGVVIYGLITGLLYALIDHFLKRNTRFSRNR